MIRNGPWAALWCPWLVPAGSCNAPTSQQLLRGYLTILPPAHQYYRYNKQESESGHWKKGEKKEEGQLQNLVAATKTIYIHR